MDFTFILLLSRALLFFSFFSLAVIWDFRKGFLPGHLLLFFLILGIPFYLFSLWKDYFQNGFSLNLSFFYSFYPLAFAFFMLFFSKLSNGALGMGDALFLLCSSLYMNYMSFFFFFLSGLICSALISIFLSLYYAIEIPLATRTLLVKNKMSKASPLPLIKKKRKNLKKISFPFIPCFIPGGIYLFSLLFFRTV